MLPSIATGGSGVELTTGTGIIGIEIIPSIIGVVETSIGHLNGNPLVPEKKWKTVAQLLLYALFHSVSTPRSCKGDEGRSLLGAGLQEYAPNHLKLPWSRAWVATVKEKAWHRTMSGEVQGDERKRTTDEDHLA